MRFLEAYDKELWRKVITLKLKREDGFKRSDWSVLLNRPFSSSYNSDGNDSLLDCLKRFFLISFAKVFQNYERCISVISWPLSFGLDHEGSKLRI